jgi:hypothetical protein
VPTYTLIGVVAGLLLAGCDVVLRIVLKRGEPELLDAVELVLACLAAAGSVKLFVLATGNQEIPALDAEDRGYMVVGSLCVCWVAVLGVVRVFRRTFAAADD